jgi:pyrimidine operon attenuation protein/uracil phosphoribosyltransferase
MRLILDQGGISRALRRIAHEIVENNDDLDQVIVVGIPTRGVALAKRLGRLLTEVGGADVAVGALDVGMHRDDLELRPPKPPGRTQIPGPLDGLKVVLVDDVIYTGRTVRAALDALAALGRPGLVQLAVLVDRGHRELPIRADYVGKNIPTSHAERVTLRLDEVDGSEGVFIESAVGITREAGHL